MIAEKEPKRALPCSQRTMELSQPKGNDWVKKGKKIENPGRAQKPIQSSLYVLVLE